METEIPGQWFPSHSGCVDDPLLRPQVIPLHASRKPNRAHVLVHLFPAYTRPVMIAPMLLDCSRNFLKRDGTVSGDKMRSRGREETACRCRCEPEYPGAYPSSPERRKGDYFKRQSRARRGTRTYRIQARHGSCACWDLCLRVVPLG